MSQLSSLPAGKSAVLQRAIAAAIRAQLSVPWLPPHCRLPLHSQTQVKSSCCILISRKALILQDVQQASASIHLTRARDDSIV